MGVAKIAGIMAAKKTSEVIPLCHPLPITHCKIDFKMLAEESAVEVSATVKVDGKEKTVAVVGGVNTIEIAERMSTTVRAVQRLLHRALIKLREEYVSLFEEAKSCGYAKCVEHNYKRILQFFEEYEIILTQNDPAA